MNSRILLKSQKNELFELLMNHGFNPIEFKWLEIRSTFDPEKIVSRLTYDKTDYFYSFEMEGEAHLAIFCPAPSSYVGTDYPGTWDNQKICFSKWLINLGKEKNEPDLWDSHIDQTQHSKDVDQRTYVTAEPSSQSPEPDQIATRIDALFERKQPFDRSGSTEKNMPPHIKRYYGKA